MRKSGFSLHLRQSQIIEQRQSSFSFNKRKIKRPNSSSVDKQAYQKFMKTSYIMSNIKKAIKNNDIKLIMGQKIQKLRTQPTNIKTEPEQVIAHNTLIDVRKKYDSMKRERVLKMQNAEKLKEKLKTYSFEESQLKNRIVGTKESSNVYKNWIQGGKLELQFTYTDKKTLQHMRSRLNSDIRFYKQNILKNNIKIRQRVLKKQNLIQQFEILQQQTSNCTNLLKQLSQSLQKQNLQRQQHLQDVRVRIAQKHTQEQIEKNRTIFEQQQAEKALLAKNSEEKNWNLVYLGNLFLKKMLVAKVEREMSKFKVVEDAYKNIKLKTQIKNTSDLVYNFINRAQITDRLLEQISRLKSKLQQVKQQNKILSQINSQLEQKKIQLQNQEYVYSISSNKRLNVINNAKIEELVDRNQFVVTMKSKMDQWLFRQIEKINVVDNMAKALAKKQMAKVKECKQPRLELFKLYLDKLSSYIDSHSKSKEKEKDKDKEKDKQTLRSKQKKRSREKSKTKSKQLQEQKLNESIIFGQQQQINLTQKLLNKSNISTGAKITNNFLLTSTTKVPQTAPRWQKTSQVPQTPEYTTSSTKLQLYNQAAAVATNQTYKPEDQIAVVNSQRCEIVQANEKFMRNLRVRNMEVRQRKG